MKSFVCADRQHTSSSFDSSSRLSLIASLSFALLFSRLASASSMMVFSAVFLSLSVPISVAVRFKVKNKTKKNIIRNKLCKPSQSFAHPRCLMQPARLRGIESSSPAPSLTPPMWSFVVGSSTHLEVVTQIHASTCLAPAKGCHVHKS